MNWKGCSKAWLIGAYIGVLGIVGAQRDRMWANDISYFTTITNTDFAVGAVGSLRDAATASIYVSGIKGTVRQAYLYWHGPMNTDFPLANASIRMDGGTVTGVHIGTSDDNCWGFDNSQAYRADVTPQVTAKRNGTYVLSQFVKQGTNINANGASLLVFFDDGNTNNNRDVVLFEGNDSNAPNAFDALGWNAVLAGVRYSTGKAYLQLHVSDGQIYPDDSVILNGVVFQGRGSIFQGTTVPSANSGPYGYGNLWDVKTWDITSRLVPGVNDFLLTHGYIQHDCISLIVAAFNLPAAAAPPPPPPPGGTNRAPTITGQPELIVHSPAAIVVEADVRDDDGDGLDYTIAVGDEIRGVGEVAAGVPQTIGRLSLTNAFPLGEHRVVFTVSDGRTNASYTTIVRVIDNTPPVVNATNLVVPTDPGKATAVVRYQPTATDDFPGEVAIVSLPASGQEFPIGVTMVTVTAVDASGNRSQTTFTVTVVDTAPPTLACPADLVRFTDPGTNNAVVVYAVNVTDNQPGAVVACVPPSGSIFPLGTSPVTCTATDAAGNRATCSFQVTINAQPPVNRPPTLTGVTNLFLNSNAPVVIEAVATDLDGHALSYVIRIDDEVVQTGTIPGGTPVTIGTLSVTNGFGVGVHTVAFEVSDGQASATFVTTVQVIDDLPPVIHVPPAIVVPVDPGTNNAVVTYTVTATDNFPGPVQVVVTPGSGSIFPLGTNTVVVTATDASGNTTNATFLVIVIDNVPPAIQCPPELVRLTDRGTNNAIVTYTVIASDNLPGHVVVCDPPSGAVFPIGSNVVTCTVTDAAGLQASCTFPVRVEVRPANRAPTLEGQAELVIHSNAPVAVVVTATDLDGDALTYTIRIDGVVVRTGTVPAGTPVTVGTLSVTNGFNVGAHAVTFEVSDGQSTATFTTTVRAIDDTPPVIHVPPTIVIPVDPGTNQAVVTYTVRATDNFPGNIEVVVTPGSGTAFPVGTNTVVVTARDEAGNSTNATFIVVVVDNVPPTIQCPPDLVRMVDPNTNTTVVTFSVNASDNVAGATVACLPPSGSVFPLGTNTVNCTVTDAAGLQASCSFRVMVERNPTSNLPPTLTGQAVLNINSNTPVVVTATATDLDGDALTYTIRVDGVVVQTGTIAAGTPITTGTLSVTNGFNVGTHAVTFEVSDGRATATLTTTITVVDDQPPVIQVPPAMVVPVDPGATNAVVVYTVTVTDNFPGPIQVVVTPESGSVFPIGTTTVVVRATDAAGNSTNATFTVTVVDNVPPTIECPRDLTRFADLQTNHTVVNYEVQASDNVPGATVVCLPPSGSVFLLGTNVVTCTVTDLAGLQASCSFKVIIERNPASNIPPTVDGQLLRIVHAESPIVVSATATDLDGDDLAYTIRIDGTVVQTGTVPGGQPLTTGTLSVTNAFTAGTHTVTFEVNDGRATASFTTTVRVVDINPPDIQIPTNIVVPLNFGETNAVVTYRVTATDDFPGRIDLVVTPESGTAFPVGTTTVVVTATDAAGNSRTVTFTVTVIDTVPPVIQCPPDIVRLVEPGANSAVVLYEVMASDNLPGATVVCVPPSGSTFPLGSTPVTCTVRDVAGLQAACTFQVTVSRRDDPPVVTVPTNLVVAADLGQCSAVVHYTVSVQDNTPGWTLVCTPPSGSIFPSGTTPVVCVVTDAAGNRVTNTFTVTVEDREKPVLQLPADITVTIATNESSAIVSYVVNATDNCSAVTVVATPASGSAFPVGTTIVQVTATDAAGNVATGSFKVIVRRGGGGDTEPPVIVSITPSKACLWPPNHKMVNVTFSVKATDNSGQPVTAQIISITSNEPENELGDGNTEHDWIITGALKAQLRAERSGTGTGRVYTIVIAVTDAAGNVTTGTTTVCVPHDQGQKDAILAGAAAKPKVVVTGRTVRVLPAKKK